MELIKRSSLFAASLGSRIGENFEDLDDNLQEILLNEAERHHDLAYGLSLGAHTDEPEQWYLSILQPEIAK